jgi:hypothetical protein
LYILFFSGGGSFSSFGGGSASVPILSATDAETLKEFLVDLRSGQFLTLHTVRPVADAPAGETAEQKKIRDVNNTNITDANAEDAKTLSKYKTLLGNVINLVMNFRLGLIRAIFNTNASIYTISDVEVGMKGDQILALLEGFLTNNILIPKVAPIENAVLEMATVESVLFDEVVKKYKELCDAIYSQKVSELMTRARDSGLAKVKYLDPKSKTFADEASAIRVAVETELAKNITDLDKSIVYDADYRIYIALIDCYYAPRVAFIEMYFEYVRSKMGYDVTKLYEWIKYKDEKLLERYHKKINLHPLFKDLFARDEKILKGYADTFDNVITRVNLKGPNKIKYEYYWYFIPKVYTVAQERIKAANSLAITLEEMPKLFELGETEFKKQTNYKV